MWCAENELWKFDDHQLNMNNKHCDSNALSVGNMSITVLTPIWNCSINKFPYTDHFLLSPMFPVINFQLKLNQAGGWVCNPSQTVKVKACHAA